MMTNLQIFPINTQEFFSEVMEAASSNGHEPLYSTHAVIKDKEIVGAFCTISPTVYWWMHTTKVNNRDSFLIFQSLDTLMNQNKYESYVLPCHPSSPYYPVLTSRLERGWTEYKGDSEDDWKLFIRK
tara:strand:- start:89 stop:469 length:381 start_codon:yes stop_codon:yes gene_type:complete